MKKRILSAVLAILIVIPMFGIVASALDHNTFYNAKKLSSGESLLDGGLTFYFDDSLENDTGYVSQLGSQFYIMTNNYWNSGIDKNTPLGGTERTQVVSNIPGDIGDEFYWLVTPFSAYDYLVNGGAFVSYGISVPTMSIALSENEPVGQATVENTDDIHGFAVDNGPVKNGIVITLSSEGNTGNNIVNGYYITCATLVEFAFIRNSVVVDRVTYTIDDVKSQTVYLSGDTENIGMTQWNALSYSDTTGLKLVTGDNFGLFVNTFTVSFDDVPELADYVSPCTNYYFSALAASPATTTSKAFGEQHWPASSFGLTRLGTDNTQPADYTGKGDACDYEYVSNEDGTHNRVCSVHDSSITYDCEFEDVYSSEGEYLYSVCNDCGYQTYIPQTYTVSFDGDGTEDLESQVVETGSIPEEPELEDLEGYNFVGWYIGDEEYDFSYAINEDVTLTAVWEVITYEVTFHLGHKSEELPADVSVYVNYGETISPEDIPEPYDYDHMTFNSYCVYDEEIDDFVPFDFEQEIYQDYTIYAVYDVINPFTDVSEDTYYYNQVMELYINGFVKGTSATTFSPLKDLTRAEFAMIIYNMLAEEGDGVGTENPFTDVPDGKWYTDAVIWAYNAGITKGTSATTFSPDRTITREEAATLVYRSLFEKMGIEIEDSNTFTDKAKISAFAEDAINFMSSYHIINGYPDGSFQPKTIINRAMSAVILSNAWHVYLNLINETT